jgi:hypothetical protein
VLATQLESSLLVAADSTGKTGLDYALASHALDCIAFLHAQGVENRMVAAISRGDMDALMALFACGYPVNSCDKTGTTPLHAAAGRGDLNMVQFLVQKGANLDVLHSNGFSPLHFAAQNMHLDVVRFLLRSGFDLRQFSPKHQPCRVCSVPQTRTFLFQYCKRQVIGSQLLVFVRQCVNSIPRIEA